MEDDLEGRRETLLIFPCSSEKVSGGNDVCTQSHLMLKVGYENVINARRHLLEIILRDKRYCAGKYEINCEIRNDGFDFGGVDGTGRYRPAIERYAGSLYTAIADFPRIVRTHSDNFQSPQIMILSALYGPLHPLDTIQNYNLQMSDSPVYRMWKDRFPPFLREYVLTREIRQIYLYMGGSTPYFKIASKATIPLFKEKLLESLVHYEVIKGNSYHTSHNHGLLIAKQLTRMPDLKFTREISEIPMGL